MRKIWGWWQVWTWRASVVSTLECGSCFASPAVCKVPDAAARVEWSEGRVGGGGGEEEERENETHFRE